MFAAATYARRRRLLRERLDGGLVLLLGNTDSPRNFADNVYPFRQDSSFLYFVGLDRPGLAAVFDLDSGEETVFGDELSIDDIVWMGDQPSLAAQAARAGIAGTRPRGDLAGVVAGAAAAGRAVHTLPPYRAENRALLQSLLPAADPRPSQALREAVIDQRSVKSPEEIAELEQAVDLSVAMHTAAMRFARPGQTEAAVAAEVERVAMAAGSGLAFATIATVDGQILHNHHHGNTLRPGALFLLDAGAESPRHYAGDLSSTFPVSPRFDSRQRAIYELSLQAHEAALAAVGPGVPNREVHFTAARVIVAGLQGLGLMRGDTEAALAAGAHAMFFPCGVGHLLGLDVHDMEDLGEQWVGYAGAPRSTQFGLKSLRLARPLQPGFTITIEPGIYFIPQLIDLWRGEGRHAEFLDYDELEKWRDFGGIRNEENVLVTAAGSRVLGRERKPRTVDEVEALRAG
jgi:Xaa-Pro aminopeptidase